VLVFVSCSFNRPGCGAVSRCGQPDELAARRLPVTGNGLSGCRCPAITTTRHRPCTTWRRSWRRTMIKTKHNHREREPR